MKPNSNHGSNEKPFISIIIIIYFQLIKNFYTFDILNLIIFF